ncbi:unnamed protein product [Enterobius vermicularis]|uniref:Ovule protein n=1 Tax=Enterobius vermicularis TaxID=51028 RepID=A0A0N4UVH8_ENTVE|nr:unnamed protein product [Enterobius vermicularis]
MEKNWTKINRCREDISLRSSNVRKPHMETSLYSCRNDRRYCRYNTSNKYLLGVKRNIVYSQMSTFTLY